MKNYRIMPLVSIIIALALAVSACTAISATTINPTDLVESEVSLANPAAVYCEGLGYTTENVRRNGGEDADCIFPSGTRCPGWDFLAGHCAPEMTYCEMHGGRFEFSGSIGICRFADGSSCDEYSYYLGECFPGDNPGEIIQEDVSSETAEVEIHDFVQARDYMAVYLLDQYGIEHTESWIEQNITPEDGVGSTKLRYVSGPVTVVISAEASAPYPELYNIEEFSNIANGFYWEGTLGFDGTVAEYIVLPPARVLNEEQARDAVLDYIGKEHALLPSREWVDDGYKDTGAVKSLRVYTSGPWVVEVEFEPAAPLVAKYQVTIENTAAGVRWEGEITLRGEITEIRYSE